MPNRRQSDRPGIATGSRVDCFSESSGSSCACAKYVHAEYVRARGAADRGSAAECCWRRQAQPGATQKRSAVLWRGLQGSLRRDSTGRLGLDSLSEAQHHDPCQDSVRQALGAVAAGATTAAAPAVAPPPVEPAPLLVSPREELFILRMACGGDYAAFCRGLRPGAGRIAACLHYNSASLSPRCQQALTSLREGR
jgi:hypothetical protein